jgi:hypothetical protein
VLVVVVVLTIVITMAVAFMGHTRSKSRGVNCLAQLRGLWVGLRQYAVDHSNLLPDPGANDKPWEDSLGAYIPDRNAFHCPADDEVYASTGSSYDWRDTGDELTTLAGKHFTDVRRTAAVLAFNALPGWHAAEMMNAVTVDGAAQPMTQRACLTDLLTPIRELSGDSPLTFPPKALKGNVPP